MAAKETIFADACHTRRDGDGSQAAAARKGIVFDVRYIFGNVDIMKAETIVKCVPSYCFYVVADCQFLQFLLILKPVSNVSAIDI